MQTRTHVEQFADAPGGHLNSCAKKIDMLNIQGDSDIIENTRTLNRPYNVNIVSLTNDTKKCIRHSEYTAYTDGSKIDEKNRCWGYHL